MNMQESSALEKNESRIKIVYRINEKDFLEHHLYVASKSSEIQKRRQKSKIRVPIFYVICGIMLYFPRGSIIFPALFLLIALLWFLYYPIWESRRYAKQYKGFLNENFKERYGKAATLELDRDFLYSSDDGSECKYKTTEVRKIQEIPSTIFILLKGGLTYILPKDQFPNLNELKIQLKEIASQWNVPYEIDEEWKWK